MTFDPLSVDFARDPYPAYAALRAAGGPVYFEPFDVWLLSRFSHVSAAALDRRLVRVMELPAAETEAMRRAANWHDMPHHQRFVQFSLLDSVPATHDRLRKLVMREFSQTSIARLRAQTQAFTGGLVETALARGDLDFVEDFAAHVPGQLIGTVLGTPDEDAGRLRRWSDDIVQFFDIDRSDARKALAEAATTQFYIYLRDLTAARRRVPRDDLITRLAAMEDRGELSHDECISTAMLILMAGHGSTIDVMASGLNALLCFPGEMAKLRADPARLPSAVQEMVRFESPLPFFHRYASEDVEFGGRRFAKGERLGLLYGAANRDPAAFSNPDRFDIARTANRHLAFGNGAHFCLGNHLARMDMEVVFGELLARTGAIERLEEPQWRQGLSVRGPRRLVVRLRPA